MTDVDFRSVGFTQLAEGFPMNDLDLVARAAWNGVTVEKLPEAMRYYPNEHSATVWRRTINAVIEHAALCRSKDTVTVGPIVWRIRSKGGEGWWNMLDQPPPADLDHLIEAEPLCRHSDLVNLFEENKNLRQQIEELKAQIKDKS